MDEPRRRSSDRIEDHHIMWKHLVSAALGASVSSMVLLSVYFVYSDNYNSSPTASLEMYEKYKDYSGQYANQLYNRVGNVTDVMTSYKRTTDYRLDQHDKLIESIQKQLAEQKATHITNTNTNYLNSGGSDEKLDVQ